MQSQMMQLILAEKDPRNGDRVVYVHGICSAIPKFESASDDMVAKWYDCRA